MKLVSLYWVTYPIQSDQTSFFFSFCSNRIKTHQFGRKWSFREYTIEPLRLCPITNRSNGREIYYREIVGMKYLGGKQRLGKHLAPVLHEIWESNEDLNGYLEPFCGSLGVLKNMTDIDTKNIQANDYHADLIQMWKEVKYYVSQDL